MNKIIHDDRYHIDYTVFPVRVTESVAINGEWRDSNEFIVYRIYSAHQRNGGPQLWTWLRSRRISIEGNDAYPSFTSMSEAYTYLEDYLDDLA